jgi:hypothetical protein
MPPRADHARLPAAEALNDMSAAMTGAASGRAPSGLLVPVLLLVGMEG